MRLGARQGDAVETRKQGLEDGVEVLSHRDRENRVPGRGFDAPKQAGKSARGSAGVGFVHQQPR